MRAKKLAVTALIFLMSSCTKHKKNTGWAEYKLEGKVKSLRQIPYKAVNKFGIQPGAIDDSYLSENLYILFNKKGKIVEYNKYDADGSLSHKETYKYDEKGNKIEYNKYEAFFNGSNKETYKYDDKGKIVEYNKYYDGSLSHKSTYKYDEKGRLIEHDTYNSDGSLSHKSTYKYDEKGNKIEYNKYKANGSLSHQWTYTYTYDKKGNWNKKIRFKNTIPKKIIKREIVYF